MVANMHLNAYSVRVCVFVITYVICDDDGHYAPICVFCVCVCVCVFVITYEVCDDGGHYAPMCFVHMGALEFTYIHMHLHVRTHA